MLFTDLTSERVVRAFKKAGFVVVTTGKHMGMSDGGASFNNPEA